MNNYKSILQYSTILFFIGFFILGNIIVDDYGLGFDDEIQEVHGWVSYDYINEVIGMDTVPKAPKEKPLMEYLHRSYGVVFQLTAVYLEKIFGQSTFIERHLLRHQMVFYLFFLASIFFYRILNRQFGNQYLALAGTLMFILSPRIFGHAFFNIKDSVLLSFFVFGLASFFRYLDNPSIRNGIAHALICGLAVNIRVVGIILPVLSVIWIIVYFLAAKDKKAFWNTWKISFGSFAILTPVFIIAFWPYLWESPLKNFVESYTTMGNYTWKGWILFPDRYYYAGKLPWYYIPQWMLISIPLFYWLLFVSGIVYKPLIWIRQLFKIDLTWFNDRDNRFLAIALSFFLLPIIIVIYKNSNVYDGWRQLHFTYVGFLLVASYGLVMLDRRARKNRTYHNCLKAFVAINFAYILCVMIQIHPHQQTYFNLLVRSTNQFEQYELDYWGVSYRSGFKELAKLVPEGETKNVYAFSNPGKSNYKYLDEEIKEKLHLTKKINDSDYYITNFRSRKERNSFLEKNEKFKDPVLFIKRQGVPLVGVFKVDKTLTD